MNDLQLSPGHNPIPPEHLERFEPLIAPIVKIDASKIIGLGTGSIVNSSGIILTALHVVEEAIKNPDDHNNIYALIRTHELHNSDADSPMMGGLLRIIKIWTNPGLDIAFCLLEQLVNIETGDPITYRCLPMQITRPSEKQRCIAFGYPISDGSITGEKSATYSSKLVSSDGVIEDVFDTKRDSVILRFPSFQVGGTFSHGMSGGPIFLDGKPGVAAVVCSGFDEGTGNGSMLWPSLGLHMDPWPPEKVTVWDAARKGVFTLLGDTDKVQVVNVSDDSSQVLYRK